MQTYVISFFLFCHFIIHAYHNHSLSAPNKHRLCFKIIAFITTFVQFSWRIFPWQSIEVTTNTIIKDDSKQLTSLGVLPVTLYFISVVSVHAPSPDCVHRVVRKRNVEIVRLKLNTLPLIMNSQVRANVLVRWKGCRPNKNVASQLKWKGPGMLSPVPRSTLSYSLTKCTEVNRIQTFPRMILMSRDNGVYCC